MAWLRGFERRQNGGANGRIPQSPLDRLISGCSIPARSGGAGDLQRVAASGRMGSSLTPSEGVQMSGSEPPGVIQCPDCQGVVSQAAVACPHCGRPQEAHSQLIEATAKRFKVIQLISAGIFGVGFVGLWLAAVSDSEILAWLAVPLLLLGFGGCAVGTALAWWHHG